MAEGSLKQVEEDAVRIQTKRFRDHFEDLQYEQSKKGESGFEAPSEQPVQLEEDVKPVEKPLNKLNKTELLAVASEEGVEVAEDATNKQIVSAIEASREGQE